MLGVVQKRAGCLAVGPLPGFCHAGGAKTPNLMKNQFENLNNNLSNINFRLVNLDELARILIESGLLEQLATHFPELVAFIRRTFPRNEPKLYLPEVLTYLGISKRTYQRKVADGKLVPHKWEGPDFYYPSDLEEEWQESKRRGRI